MEWSSTFDCMPRWKATPSLEKHRIPARHPKGNCESPAPNKKVSSHNIVLRLGKNGMTPAHYDGSEPETTAHFLLRCSKLSNIRQQYLPKVMSCYEQPSPDLLVRVILDSSYISENRITHETLCRNYTYKLQP